MTAPEQPAAVIEALPRERCIDMLTAHRIGRIGLSVDDLPMVTPVRCRLVGRDLVIFGLPAGSALEADVRQTVVAFEVDETNSVAGTERAVLVIGVATPVDDPEERERLQHTIADPWLTSHDGPLFSLSTERISGHRVTRRREQNNAARHHPRITELWVQCEGCNLQINVFHDDATPCECETHWHVIQKETADGA